MVVVNTRNYTILPSDTMEWLIIRSPNGIEIDVEVAIVDYLYKCVPKQIEIDGHTVFCSQLCCYAGCYVSQAEINQAKKILPEILPDLQEDAQKLLKQNGFQIDEPSDCDEEEHVTKIRCAPREWIYPDDETEDQDEDEEDEESESEITEFDMPPKNHCIFLMKNGLCALHKYYLDTGQNWVTQKFNICTTFPIDARVEDKTLAFMKEFDDFAFAEIECLSGDMEMKEDLDYPQLIDSMKDVIIDRFGKEWWNSLNNFAKDYRAGLIDLDYIYSDVDL